MAEDIMSKIIQDAEASRAGETLLEYRYNASRQPSYSEVGDFAGLNLNEVIVLTGPKTCSASELIINGLKPYIQTVVSIGETTCGKPYGMEVEDYCGHSIAAITFETLTKLGQGGYSAGIAPTCEIVDPIDGEFGDVNETLYAAALTYIETGNCPASRRRSNVSPIQVPNRSIGNLVFD
ncbi:MAG: hypothetical protein HWE20_00545 [Gammaproteobacteria bacterium]|nr:hypothetical protein [Gammaproteobacteria bacterium]